MKRIILTESQYNKLITKSLKEEKEMVTSIDGDIGYKGSEFTNGGPVSIEWEEILNDLDDMLDDEGIKYKITAGNDSYHHRKNKKSRHTIGCAVDFAIRNRINAPIRKSVFNHMYSTRIYEIMEILKSTYSHLDFSWLDEYNRPSGHASGGHIHMSINRKYCNNYDSGQEIKSQSATPPISKDDFEDDIDIKDFPDTDVKTQTKKTTGITIEDIIDNNNNSEIISLGSRGEGVEEIQEILDELGYDLGSAKVDGIFGTFTYDAVRQFQEDNDLIVDGVVGLQTSKELFHSKNAGLDPLNLS